MSTNLLTLTSSMTEILFSGHKTQLFKIHILIPLTLHAAMVLFLMNIFPSLIRSHHFLSPATLISDNSAVSVLTSILKQPVPSQPLLSTLNLTTVTLSTTIFQGTKSQINCLQQIQNCLACTVANAPKCSHITPILRSVHWLKVNKHIEYKLL